MPVYNVLIAGIGGQGVITLGTVLKRAALRAGIHVSGSERRGGAQREGHVASIVRYQWQEDGHAADERHEVCSPMLRAGGADLLIGLEPLEAARLARYLSEESSVILNTFPYPPIPVKLGEATYPSTQALVEMLQRLTVRVYDWNLTQIARERFGHSRAMNAICLGIVSTLEQAPVSEAHLLGSLQEEGRSEDIEGFRLGVELANERTR